MPSTYYLCGNDHVLEIGAKCRDEAVPCRECSKWALRVSETFLRRAREVKKRREAEALFRKQHAQTA